MLNKVSGFTTSPLLRHLIGQPCSSFDFRWLTDNSKTLLCDLPKRALGEDVSFLLGSLIVTKLSVAALSRQDAPEQHRRPHVPFVDEAHCFLHGVDFPTILGEGRKYRLVVTIATQTMNQLPEKSLAALFGNCATIIRCRVSGEDAEILKREFATLLQASEFQELEDYKLCVRTLVPGRPRGLHLIRAFPRLAATGQENSRERVVRTGLQRFGRSRAQVAGRINRFLSRRQST